MGMPAARPVAHIENTSDAINEVDRLQACLEAMEPDEAQLLSLYYVENLTTHEISDILGITDLAARQLLGNALEQLDLIRACRS